MKIETIYRCYTAYEIITDDSNRDADNILKINSKILDFEIEAEKTDVIKVVENNTGGPCWGPYFVVESENRVALEQFVNKVTRYMKRFRGIEIQ